MRGGGGKGAGEGEEKSEGVGKEGRRWKIAGGEGIKSDDGWEKWSKSKRERGRKG